MPERGATLPSWVELAGKFPASLVRDTAPEALGDGSTPDAYGLGIDRLGFLYAAAAAPTGSEWNGIVAASEPSNTPLTGTQYWRFAHNRLWGFQTAGTNVRYGSYGYDSNYLMDGLGYIPCDYETSSIVQVVPFGGNVAILKAGGLYVVRNADTPSNNFVAEYVREGTGLTVAANVVAIGATLVWANTTGVWSYDGQSVTELTRMVRSSLGTFTAATLTSLKADFPKARVVGYTGASAVCAIDLGETPGLYDYATSGLRWTSKTISGNEGEPLLIDKVALLYNYAVDDAAYVSLDVKINDIWYEERRKPIYPKNDNGRLEIPLDNVFACRRWTLRLTEMSQGLYVSRVLVHVKQGGVQGYSNK